MSLSVVAVCSARKSCEFAVVQYQLDVKIRGVEEIGEVLADPLTMSR